MYYDYYFYYFSYFTSIYNSYPLIIRLTLSMVILLSVIALIGIIRLLYTGYKIHRRNKIKTKTQEYFKEPLTFVMKNSVNYDVEEIQELLQCHGNKAKRWQTDILTDLVLKVKNSVYKLGELNDINYKNSLEALHLMGFWEKRSRTSGLDRRREALQIIGQIDNGVNTGVLSKSTFHKNKQLRKTARDIHTSLDNYNPFRFMEDNFDEAFTQLDKLRLHATLIKRSKEGKLPILLRWISNSKNPNYIIFILREIGYFKQNETAPTLMSMLDKQENKDVRVQIIRTLGNLNYTECVCDLMQRFTLESSKVREAIVTTLGELKEAGVLKFLIGTYSTTEDGNFKLTIARAIINHGSEGRRALRSLQQEANKAAQDKESTLLAQVISERAVLSF